MLLKESHLTCSACTAEVRFGSTNGAIGCTAEVRFGSTNGAIGCTAEVRFGSADICSFSTFQIKIDQLLRNNCDSFNNINKLGGHNKQ
jgi:hypothetical protein